MEWTDVLIVVLMMASPVIAAIADSKKKKQARQGNTYVEAPKAPKDTGPLPQASPARREFLEGEKAAQKPAEIAAEPETRGKVHLGKIDPEKLIIYSAIMKPKFDEGLD